jgi:hypothetical protein
MRLGLRLRGPADKLPRMAHAAALVALAIAWTAVAADERVIRYDKDTLTVHLTKAPLSEVVDEVARQTGAEVRGQLRSPHDVTAEFNQVPFPEAMHRLLSDENFALVYAHDGRLRALKLLGSPLAPPAPGTTPVPPPPPPAPGVPASPADLAALVSRHAPVPIAGHLADIVGAPTASLPQLFDLGVRHEDATVRAEAVRAIVSTLEIDPALRTAVIGHLNNVDDVALSTMLRGAAGDHAEEVAMQVLAHARASEIRVKASSVLQRLRAGS